MSNGEFDVSYRSVRHALYIHARPFNVKEGFSADVSIPGVEGCVVANTGVEDSNPRHNSVGISAVLCIDGHIVADASAIIHVGKTPGTEGCVGLTDTGAWLCALGQGVQLLEKWLDTDAAADVSAKTIRVIMCRDGFAGDALEGVSKLVMYTLDIAFRLGQAPAVKLMLGVGVPRAMSTRLSGVAWGAMVDTGTSYARITGEHCRNRRKGSGGEERGPMYMRLCLEPEVASADITGNATRLACMLSAPDAARQASSARSRMSGGVYKFDRKAQQCQSQYQFRLWRRVKIKAKK